MENKKWLTLLFASVIDLCFFKYMGMCGADGCVINF